MAGGGGPAGCELQGAHPAGAPPAPHRRASRSALPAPARPAATARRPGGPLVRHKDALLATAAFLSSPGVCILRLHSRWDMQPLPIAPCKTRLTSAAVLMSMSMPFSCRAAGSGAAARERPAKPCLRSPLQVFSLQSHPDPGGWAVYRSVPQCTAVYRSVPPAFLRGQGGRELGAARVCRACAAAAGADISSHSSGI